VFTRGGFVTSTDKASTTGIERMGCVRTRESRTGVRSAVITLRGAQPNTVFTISYYTSDGGCILGDGGFGTITTDARGTASKTVQWTPGALATYGFLIYLGSGTVDYAMVSDDLVS
jgi:hypothetical protein